MTNNDITDANDPVSSNSTSKDSSGTFAPCTEHTPGTDAEDQLESIGKQQDTEPETTSDVIADRQAEVEHPEQRNNLQLLPVESNADAAREHSCLESKGESTLHSACSDESQKKMLQLLAPANMEEGYRLQVDVDKKVSLVVEVPTGGVREGQTFVAQIISQDSFLPDIPRGEWRDGIFACCNLGCFHPSLCLGAWLTPCALGQVLARMKLDCCARPGVQDAFSAHSVLFFLTAGLYVIVFDFTVILLLYDHDDGDETPKWVRFMIIFMIVVGSCFLFLVVSNTVKARSFIRKKYDIPEGKCRGCEDACCAIFCNPCSICQMSRHSADYRSNLAACCTRNGLMDYVKNPV